MGVGGWVVIIQNGRSFQVRVLHVKYIKGNINNIRNLKSESFERSRSHGPQNHPMRYRKKTQFI